MPTKVLVSRLANQQIAELTGKDRKHFDSFHRDLVARGCAALAYRLAGPHPLNHTCVKHLRGQLRVVVAFQTRQQALIITVGEHNDQDPAIDVYTKLYGVLGVQPEDDDRRTKPPCCDEIDQLPPVIGQELADHILVEASAIRRTRRPTTIEQP